MFGLHEKTNLLHPPAVRTARGGEKRVRSVSQREGDQLPVDALNVLRSRRPRLSAFARGRHDCRRDGAGSTVATAGQRRTLAVEAGSLGRAERGRGGRSRCLLAALRPSAGVLVLA